MNNLYDNFASMQETDDDNVKAQIEAGRIRENDYNEKEEGYQIIVSQMRSSVARVLKWLLAALAVSIITILIWPENVFLSWLTVLLGGAVLWQIVLLRVIYFSEKRKKYDLNAFRTRDSKKTLENIIWTEGTYREKIPDNITLTREDIEEIRKIDVLTPHENKS